MKCKFCDAELEAENLICPGCGAVNEPEAEAETAQEEVVQTVIVEEPAKHEVTEGLKGWKLALVIGVCTLLCTAMVLVVLWGAGMIGGIDAEPGADVTEPTTDVNNATVVDTYTVSDAEAMAAADKVVATLGQLELNNGQLQIYYWMQVFDFLNNYGTYYFDYAQPLNAQYYDETSGVTWEQYFVDVAIETWHRYAALYLLGQEAGFELTQAQKDELAALPQQLEGMLQTYGFEDTDALIRNDFGPGANAQAYYDYMSLYMECLEYFNGEYEKMKPSEEDIIAYYEENEEDFITMGYTRGAMLMDVRHILLQPETNGTDENGKAISTDDDIEACRQAAQTLLDQWLAGDATEDSFAALAAEHTTDSGSASNGGLYTDIYEGQMVPEFEDWCFDESRQPGDYGIVQTSYGFHLMYFVQARESNDWYLAAESNMMNEQADAMVTAAKDKWPVEVNYEDIALGFVDLAG